MNANEAANLSRLASRRIRAIPEALLSRAADYLHTRETKSSFAIERLTPGSRRAATFVELLRLAGTMDVRSGPALVRLQRSIVEERSADSSYRTDRNYIGESLGPTREWVRSVPPRPQDLRGLMDGWTATYGRLEKSSVDAVVVAALGGFGFVFLHPFGDGNRRIHRFLIRHVLAKRGFTPAPVVGYRTDERGEMTALNDTGALYRFPDLTTQAEALFGFVSVTIETELAAEPVISSAFDAARRKMIEVVDMPDRRLDLFIRPHLQGKGRLSAAKRKQFPELNDAEVDRLEALGRDELSTMAEADEE